MTRIEILGMVAPVLGGLVVIVTALVANYFDERKAKAERKARPSSHDNHHVGAPSAAE